MGTKLFRTHGHGHLRDMKWSFLFLADFHVPSGKCQFFQIFAKECRRFLKPVSSADFLAMARSVLPRRQIILAVQRNIFVQTGQDKKGNLSVMQ